MRRLGSWLCAAACAGWLLTGCGPAGPGQPQATTSRAVLGSGSIAFVGYTCPYDTCNQRGGRLYRYWPDTGRLTRVHLPDGLHPTQVAWSPVGNRVALVATVGARTGRLYIYSPATGTVRFVAEGGDPAWSADGRRLAFDRGDGVFAVPAAGGTPRRVPGRWTAPAWSPTGDLAMLGPLNPAMLPKNGEYPGLPCRSCAIWLTDPDGEHQRRLVGAHLGGCWFAGLQREFAPLGFTPNGRQLLVEAKANVCGVYGLAVVNVASARSRWVFFDRCGPAFQCRSPMGASWDPTGQLIVVSILTSGRKAAGISARLYWLPVNGGGLHPLQLRERFSVALSPSWVN